MNFGKKIIICLLRCARLSRLKFVSTANTSNFGRPMICNATRSMARNVLRKKDTTTGIQQHAKLPYIDRGSSSLTVPYTPSTLADHVQACGYRAEIFPQQICPRTRFEAIHSAFTRFTISRPRPPFQNPEGCSYNIVLQENASKR